MNGFGIRCMLDSTMAYYFFHWRGEEVVTINFGLVPNFPPFEYFILFKQCSLLFKFMRLQGHLKAVFKTMQYNPFRLCRLPRLSHIFNPNHENFLLHSAYSMFSWWFPTDIRLLLLVCVTAFTRLMNVIIKAISNCYFFRSKGRTFHF